MEGEAELSPVLPLLFEYWRIRVLVEFVIIVESKIEARALVANDTSLHHHAVPHKCIA